MNGETPPLAAPASHGNRAAISSRKRLAGSLRNLVRVAGVFLAGLLFVLPVACGQDTLPEGMDAETLRALGLGDDVVFQPGVHYVTPTQSATATIAEDTLTFPVPDNPWLSTVAEGDVLWSPHGHTWEQTFVRRVEAVTEEDGHVAFLTREAGLDAVFASMSFSTDNGRDDGARVRPTTDNSDSELSLTEATEVLDAFYPDTLAGLPKTPQGRGEYEDGGLTWQTGFESASKSWSRNPSSWEAAKVYVQIDNIGDPSNRSNAEHLLSGRSWFGTTHRGQPVYRRERPRSNAIEVVVYDHLLVIVRGNVDYALLNAALDDLDLTRLEGLISGDAALARETAAIESVADSSAAATFRALLPYRLGGLPRAGRAVIHDGTGAVCQARAVWSEDPYSESSPRLVAVITVFGSTLIGCRARNNPEWVRSGFIKIGQDGRYGATQWLHEDGTPGGAIASGTQVLGLTVEGHNVDMSVIRAAVEALDLDRIFAPGGGSDENDSP